MAHDENGVLERKVDYDPSNPSSRLQLVKEIVAMANSHGGTIRIGESDDGRCPGVDDERASALDPARVCDLVDSFIAPEHLELTHQTGPSDEPGRVVVEIVVPAHPRPPLVFTKDGNYRSRNDRQEYAFRRGDVYVRKGTKAERATRADFLTWTNDAVERERERWRSRMSLVAELPPDAELSFTTGNDVPQDEPVAILNRAVPIWKRDPSKLLSGQELATLLLARDGLEPAVDGQRLILHSALRRHATLWHWLSDFSPTPASVADLLIEAIGGSDRDKSDAGSAIVDVAALVLGDSEYDKVVGRLATSTYAHFREAAAVGCDRPAVIDALRGQRAANAGGAVLREQSDFELRTRTRELCAELIAPGRHQSQSRTLRRIGLELFARSRLGGRLA
jgi:hypothetical protein